MKLQRAVCPVKQYIPANWQGWTIVSTETVHHTPGVCVRGGDRHTKGWSTGNPHDVYHLSRAWK